MKTPPARRKLIPTSAVKTFKEMAQEHRGYAKAIRESKFICAEPQTKPHEHGDKCPQCVGYGETIRFKFPIIKWETKEIPCFKPQPTFSIHVAWFLWSIFMFAAGFAWAYPYWIKN